MKRERADGREQQRVGGDLQTELDRLLQRDGDERGDGAGTEPPRGRAPRLAEPPAYVADEQEEADRRRNHDQRPALGRELQVVVVRLGVVLLEIVALVEQVGRSV